MLIFQNKEKLFAIVLLVFFLLAALLLNYQNFESKKNLYLEKQISTQAIGWKSVYAIDETDTNAFFNNLIMNKKVLTLLKQYQDPTQSRLARLKLYREMYTLYPLLKEQGIYVLHFHTPDNHSLLRMHLPYKFGDDLTAQRPAVVQVNTNLKPLHGFEVGKIYAAFRHIYPIVTDGVHLGSVEFSKPFEPMRQKMELLDSQPEYLMILRKDLVISKAEKGFKYYFGNSMFSDDWVEEDPLRELPNASPHNSQKIQEIAQQLKSNVNFQQKLKSGSNFTFLTSLNGVDYLLTFIKLNNVLGQHAGYLISFKEDKGIQQLKKEALIVGLIIFFFFILLLFFVLAWLNSKQKQAKSLNFLTNITQSMAESLCVVDTKGLITEINQACLRFFNQKRSKLLGTPLNNWLKLSSSNDHNTQLFDLIQQQTEFTEEFIYQGQKIWLHFSCHPLMEQNKIHSYVILFKDITAQKQAELDLQIAATAFETQEAIMITDNNGTILKVNQAFSRLTGYTQSEVIGKTPSVLKSGKQSSDFYQKMWASLKKNKFWQGELWNHRKDGSLYLEWLTITAITDQTGKITRYVANFSDITQQKEAQETIAKLAYYDPLTNLPNRRLLFERLNQAIATSERHHEYGAILFIDLDNFKALNDAKGHSLGDQLLIQVAKALTQLTRKTDTVARLGGDEFVILLEDLGKEKSQAISSIKTIADKIIEQFKQPFMLADDTLHHTAPSIGIELFYKQQSNIEDILKHADLAMYQSKKQGGNCFHFFDANMQKTIEHEHALEEALRDLIHNNFKGLILFYQSQVDHNGKVISAEALIRWQHPEKGLVSPADFIPLIEKNGMIIPIGYWVLETAIKKLISWQQTPELKHLSLAVNISAKQLLHPNFVKKLKQLIDHYSFDISKLKLELTESAVVDDIEQATQVMQKIHQLGIRFSMDDFGTGYSSLSYLSRLPLEQLKIDQSFVKRLEKEPDAASIIKIIILLAHNLGLYVVAEGVETNHHYQFLKQKQCDLYQGYLFNRPLSSDEFDAFVLSKNEDKT